MVAKPLSMIFEKSWHSEKVPGNWKRENISFKRVERRILDTYQSISLASMPGKSHGQLLLEAVPRHMEDREVIQDCQHTFTKGKSCLTSPVAFSDGMTLSVVKGKATDANYLDFCKDFDTVLHNISKLKADGFDEWTVRWIRK